MLARQSPRKPLPRIWLMTDPRMASHLLAAIQKLPAGSGVVFRHYQLDARERQSLFAVVRRICARRGHVLLVAGQSSYAGADGYHGAGGGRALIRSMAVHDWRELHAAKRHCADLVFISPVHSTRSHAGQRPLGVAAFMQIARCAAPAKVIALGGMNYARAAMLDARIVHGWAAIDAFSG
jgi:thiamine-phosphate pyrophosphorylase